jgi:hypothetical protein
VTPRPAQRAIVRPADGLLDPIPLLALATLVLNDQVLKGLWPGVVTGKLSDLAGLVVAPLALQASWEIGTWLAGRWKGPSLTVLAAAIVIVGAAFAAIQILPPATDLYRWAMGPRSGRFAPSRRYWRARRRRTLSPSRGSST